MRTCGLPQEISKTKIHFYGSWHRISTHPDSESGIQALGWG